MIDRGKTVGRYQILEKVGQGGMASVYRALDTDVGRQVALKVLLEHIADDAMFKARFEREIKLLRQLQHPNIIPILDFGNADGRTFIAMPYLGAGTLGDRLARGPVDPVTGGRIVDQLAVALQFAHDAGVVHRDIKPSNVLLDDDGNALLSDFSLAHLQDASQDLTGSAMVGTPMYMSPEQCRGGKVDARSDQYSFSVLLYQMTTGVLPFDGETPMAIAMHHLGTPLPRPTQVNPNLPVGVEMVLIRGLAKDPALRYGSIAELNRAFQAALTAALDPRRRNGANATTRRLDRTDDLYNRYQNVKPVRRPRRFGRTAVAAALLALLACGLAAGALTAINPGFRQPAQAAPGVEMSEIQKTVDALLTERAPAEGTELAPGSLETAVFEAVLQTIAAGANTGTPAPNSPTAAPSQDAPATVATTATPSATATAARTAMGTTPSATFPFLPSLTVALTGTSTSPLPTATPTFAATATNSPPTATSPLPTSTVLPLVCSWQESSPSVLGDVVSVRITNTGTRPLLVTWVSITWTGGQHLQQINWRFEEAFWSGNDPGPTVSSATSKSVPVGTFRTVEFDFWALTFNGTATVTFNIGC